ncbi:DNA polymerase III subunit delta [Halalkalibacillus halophilus]|uniref:DNA polymerase III subunit delta n=1 Tax=Halalkalibacillus halophilus TaxID=392827 RepID=UPI0003FFB0C1|nr:DNA polymerase III subunit delta [Halalkalibacillus halophilus]
MHAQQFIQSKKAIKQASIYVLFGEESYFIQAVQKRIFESVFHSQTEHDVQRYDMESIPVQEAIHDAETFPFFTDHKGIIIDRAYFLTGQTKSTDFEHSMEALSEYIEQPTDFTTLVIVAPYEKMDSRKKIVKRLKEKAELIDCSSPNENNMRNIILEMAKQKNLTIPEEVTDLLLERIGDQIGPLQQELEKLSNYFKDEEINLEEAKDLISPYAETSTFSLIDSLVKNRLQEGLLILKELRKQGEEPIALLALTTSQLRLILQAKLLKKKGYQQNQIAKQLGAHPYAVKMALSRERLFNSYDLKEILKLACLTDEKMKTGQEDKWLALELFVQKIVQQLQKAS